MFIQLLKLQFAFYGYDVIVVKNGSEENFMNTIDLGIRGLSPDTGQPATAPLQWATPMGATLRRTPAAAAPRSEILQYQDNASFPTCLSLAE